MRANRNLFEHNTIVVGLGLTHQWRGFKGRRSHKDWSVDQITDCAWCNL